MAAANAYLPEFIKQYNTRFARPPRSLESAHRPLQPGEDLERILCLCETRTLSKNLTLSYNNVIYQIQTKRAAYTMRKAQVQVRQNNTGVITIEHKGRSLEHTIYRELEQQQAQVIHSKLLPVARSRPQSAPQVPAPPASHPWRNFAFGNNSIEAKERRG